MDIMVVRMVINSSQYGIMVIIQLEDMGIKLSIIPKCNLRYSNNLNNSSNISSIINNDNYNHCNLWKRTSSNNHRHWWDNIDYCY